MTAHPKNCGISSPLQPARVPVALVALWRKSMATQKLEILVAKRTADAQILPGEWEIPGGKIETGESPAAAAARELLEETGVDCTDPSCIWLDAGVVEPPAPAGRPHPQFHLFSVQLPAGSVPRALAAQAVAWVEVGLLHKIDWPQTNEAVVHTLIDALAKHGQSSIASHHAPHINAAKE